jgi:hypothetical protein
MKLRDKAFDLFHEDMPMDKIGGVLRVMNRERCDPPLSDAQIERAIREFRKEAARNTAKEQVAR